MLNFLVRTFLFVIYSVPTVLMLFASFYMTGKIFDSTIIRVVFTPFMMMALYYFSTFIIGIVFFVGMLIVAPFMREPAPRKIS